MNKIKVIALCIAVFLVAFVLGSITNSMSIGYFDKLDKQQALEMCEPDIVKYNILLDELVASSILLDETTAKFGHIEGISDMKYAIVSGQNTLKIGYNQLVVACPEDLMKNVMTVDEALLLIEK